MAKIGTAHVEIKPVLNDEALTAITDAIEEAVARGVQRGMQAKSKVEVGTISIRLDGRDIPATLYTHYARDYARD